MARQSDPLEWWERHDDPAVAAYEAAYYAEPASLQFWADAERRGAEIEAAWAERNAQLADEDGRAR